MASLGQFMLVLLPVTDLSETRTHKKRSNYQLAFRSVSGNRENFPHFILRDYVRLFFFRRHLTNILRNANLSLRINKILSYFRFNVHAVSRVPMTSKLFLLADRKLSCFAL